MSTTEVRGCPKGYRVCHAQSARKHRKMGHSVVRIRGLSGMYAWRNEAE